MSTKDAHPGRPQHHRPPDQYAVCERTHHPVVFWAYCNVPHRLLAERLVHLKLKAHGATLVPEPCDGCHVNHREFYSLSGFQTLEDFKVLDRILKRRSNDHEGKRLVAGAGKGAGRAIVARHWFDLHSEGQMKGIRLLVPSLRSDQTRPSDSHLGRVNQREGHKFEAKTGGTDKSAKPAGGLQESNGFGFGTPEVIENPPSDSHSGRVITRVEGDARESGWRATMPTVHTIFAVGCVAWASYKDNE
ncbi:hypothetical protein B0H10DRAFT_1968662 [Mycena sp. CBHHK59/15]|nr:hypothetical protein B0H10DRAFT_1968662 [Mycena sp. CBHHK59/15]